MASAPMEISVTPAQEEVRKLGPWIVGDTLGEGGFSKVKLGVHEKTGEKVALKLLKNKSKMNKQVQKQVEREIAAMSKLDHLNILRMKDVDWNATYTKKNGKKVDIILVVLELATGGELFEFLSYTGFFEESIARTYFQQLMEGVEYAHKQGVVHRDLKPENLLLNEKFVLKLADFGFSNVVCASQKLMFTECGTPGYMAPEMFKGAGYDGMAADIWACGVILFIMLSGFPPFQKPANSDWWFNKLSSGKHALFWQAHSRSAYFSESTKDFINKILNPDPAKRISIADMKKHAWWKGPVVTQSALVAELTRRKNTVDVSKEREKERKRQEKAALDGEVVVRGEGAVARADKDDELPDSPPKFTLKNVVYKEPTQAPVSADLGLGDLSAAIAESKKVVRALPADITRYTRFNAKEDQDPTKIIERIIDVIKSIDGGKFEEYKDAHKMRADIGKVSLVVEVFTAPDSPKDAPQYVVDFRRKKGSAAEFRAQYGEIRAQLADVVKQPKGEAVKEEAPAAAESAMSDD